MSLFEETAILWRRKSDAETTVGGSDERHVHFVKPAKNSSRRRLMVLCRILSCLQGCESKRVQWCLPASRSFPGASGSDVPTGPGAVVRNHWFFGMDRRRRDDNALRFSRFAPRGFGPG